jgi:hypothetical protein
MPSERHVEYIPLSQFTTTTDAEDTERPLSASGLDGVERPASRKTQLLRPLLYLLALLLIYFIVPLLFNGKKVLPPPPTYLSHAGRSALDTTITIPKLQYEFPDNQGGDENRRDQIRETIKRTWDLYKQEAWGWDEVRPCSGGGHDTRYVP